MSTAPRTAAALTWHAVASEEDCLLQQLYFCTLRKNINFFICFLCAGTLWGTRGKYHGGFQYQMRAPGGRAAANKFSLIIIFLIGRLSI